MSANGRSKETHWRSKIKWVISSSTAYLSLWSKAASINRYNLLVYSFTTTIYTMLPTMFQQWNAKAIGKVTRRRRFQSFTAPSPEKPCPYPPPQPPFQYLTKFYNFQTFAKNESTLKICLQFRKWLRGWSSKKKSAVKYLFFLWSISRLTRIRKISSNNFGKRFLIIKI